MDVSIVIVNYNTRNLLSDCIRSIRQKTNGLQYEIIVVDNASSDDSMNMLQKDYPEVIRIEAGENLGFGKANNLGMQLAKGNYILLLNSDTILINNAVKEFYDKAKLLENSRHIVGVLGAILLDRDNNTCHSYGQFITPLTELREVVAKYLRFLKPRSNTQPAKATADMEVDYVTGADMFIPRKVFELTGGFDPDYFMYCEEVDWQKRMAEKGYERIVIPGPEIIHLEGGSDTTKKNVWSPSRLENLYKSRKIYRNKHYSKWIRPIFRVVHIALDTPSLLLLALIKKEKKYLRLIKLK